MNSIAEEYRLAAKEWVQLKKAAHALEEHKSDVLASLMKACGDVPVAHAERDVRAGKAWKDYINSYLEASHLEREARKKLSWIEIRHAERQSSEATARAEMRL